VELSRASSAFGEGQGWTNGGTKEVLILPSEQELSRLGEFPYVCIYSIIIFVLYCMNMMPMNDQNLFIFVFWKISRNRLAALNEPSGDTSMLLFRVCFEFCDGLGSLRLFMCTMGNHEKYECTNACVFG